MAMRWLLAVWVMWAGVAAGQQVDPDAYKTALDRLNRAATQKSPASQPTELERLRAENADLRRQLAALSAEVAKLRKAAQPPAVIIDPKVKIGMTPDQVRELFPQTRLIGESAGAVTRTYYEHRRNPESTREITVRFEDGKAVSIDYGEWGYRGPMVDR